MKGEKEFVSILIPDGEIPISIRVLQSLSEVRGCKIFVLANNKHSIIRYSRHIAKFFYYDKSDGLENWFSTINHLVRSHDIDVIMPVFETSIREFVENKSLLDWDNKVLVPEKLEQFDNARNKWFLHTELQKLGIPSPKSFDLADPGFQLGEIASLRFPVLIKPKSELQGGGKGIIKFLRRKDLEEYLIQNQSNKQNILQEYFDGLDLGCNVICKNGQILACTIQLGFLFDKSEFRPQIGLRMIDEENVRLAVTKLMNALQWTGVAHIDFLYNPKSKEFVVLEINPRYWLTLQASTFAGVNFPWLYCRTVIGEQFELPEYQKSEYLELRGVFKKVWKNPFYLLKVRTIWKVSPINYFVKDPVMAAYHLIWSLRSRLRNTD